MTEADLKCLNDLALDLEELVDEIEVMREHVLGIIRRQEDDIHELTHSGA